MIKDMHTQRTNNSILGRIARGTPGPMHRDAYSSIVHNCPKLEMTSHFY